MFVIIVNVKSIILYLFYRKNLMKSFFNTILYLIVLFSFANRAYALSDKQIKKICQNKQRRSTCIKNLKFKKLNLIQGNRIEIPVLPFKK